MSGMSDDMTPDIRDLRDAVREFARSEVVPIAQRLHLANEQLPDTVVDKMQEMGFYGVDAPVEAGGLGLGAMGAAVVTEELSHAWMSAGYLPLYNWSLIRMLQRFGTAAQQWKWLPGLVRGDLQTAHAGTEAQAGSDAANLQTSAVLNGSRYIVSGSKLWCTHANRADVLTVMCRTRKGAGHDGISLLLLEKPRGEQFVPPRLSGHRIDTVGARGIHSYALFFDDYEVPQENLLGGVEGMGFKHLMIAYEFARMHCAFASIGVARQLMTRHATLAKSVSSSESAPANSKPSATSWPIWRPASRRHANWPTWWRVASTPISGPIWKLAWRNCSPAKLSSSSVTRSSRYMAAWVLPWSLLSTDSGVMRAGKHRGRHE